MALTDRERAVCDAIADRRDELVGLASALIAYDTTARQPGDPPRDEAALQAYLQARLESVGASTDLFEPDAAALAGSRLVPPGLEFAGRPQLIARKAGRGGGRSLVLNGHVDVVSGEPRDAWAGDPFAAEVRDGRLYGRGACDMKGGIAAMVFAVEALAAADVALDGDLIVATNTDEESSGAGGLALVTRGLRADAAIVPEPSSFDVWVGCRGSEYGVIRVPGRPGHADLRQPDWHHGGAVNAIEKAVVVLEALQRLRAEWATRDHLFLSPPNIVPTMARSGEWRVTYPADCAITFGVQYLARQADDGGWGSAVQREVAEWIVRESGQRDDWLAAHPPVIEWSASACMPYEIDPGDPIVTTMLGASADVGRPGARGGLDSWFDGATLAQLAAIPTIAFGPPGIDRAHTIDEYVPVDGLVACAQALAVAVMRFCGPSLYGRQPRA